MARFAPIRSRFASNWAWLDGATPVSAVSEAIPSATPREARAVRCGRLATPSHAVRKTSRTRNRLRDVQFIDLASLLVGALRIATCAGDLMDSGRRCGRLSTECAA